jgi:hypothetical protein
MNGEHHGLEHAPQKAAADTSREPKYEPTFKPGTMGERDRETWNRIVEIQGDGLWNK